MPAATPTTYEVRSINLSSADLEIFTRCDKLQNSIVKARLWLALLALLSLLDAPAMLIESRAVPVADFYSAVLGILAVPLVCHVNWCKTVQFAHQHGMGKLRLSLKGIGVFGILRRSIYRNELIAELVVWLIFAPPYIKNEWPSIRLLDLCCFGRIYALLLYYGTQHYSCRVSCQALARLFRRHINLHFVLASTLYSNPGAFLATLVVVFWSVCSLLFSRLEGRSLGDSFYFVWVSCALIGYGDVYPRTFGGQVVAILCGTFSWVVLGFAIHPLSNKAAGFHPRENLYLITLAVLLMFHKREAAAVVVTCTIRHARARRRHRHPVLGKSIASAADLQRTASSLHSSCKAFVHVRNLVHHHVGLFDKMIEEVHATKFLEVFTTDKNKAERHRDWLHPSPTPSPSVAESSRGSPVCLSQAEIVADAAVERVEAKITYLSDLFLRLSEVHPEQRCISTQV